MNAVVPSLAGEPLLVVVGGAVAGGKQALFCGLTFADISVRDKWLRDERAALFAVVSPDAPDAPFRVAGVVGPEYAVYCRSDGVLSFGYGDIGIRADMQVASDFPNGQYDSAGGKGLLVGSAQHANFFTPSSLEFWSLSCA